MSIHKAQLRKVLKFFYLDKAGLQAKTREDIRGQRKKETGNVKKGKGGDFFIEFWRDAKDHILGKTDLVIASQQRIEKNKGKQRLYTELTNGFLKWWNEKRRWSNENIELLLTSPTGYVEFKSISCIVKVDNMLAIKIGDNSQKIIYPYFSEEPNLSKEAARIGLWLMSQALPEHNVNGFRILDVLRGNSFTIEDCPFQGNEEELFINNYKRILDKWNELRPEYDDYP
jgi:hypothetical protein